MSHIVTSKYRVEVICKTLRMDPFSWRVKDHGKPTAENLERFVETLNASFRPGGVNAHVGDGGSIIHARLVRNVSSPQQVICEVKGAK